MSNSLDPDQARQFVGPDLGPNCLPRLSADDTGRQRVKVKLFGNLYNETCVKGPYTARHILAFSERWLLIATLLSCRNKQPPVNRDFHVT